MSKESSQILLGKLLPVIQRHKLAHSKEFLVDVTHAAQELLTEFAAILIEGAPSDKHVDAIASIVTMVDDGLKEKLAVLIEKKRFKKSGISVVTPEIEVVPG